MASEHGSTRLLVALALVLGGAIVAALALQLPREAPRPLYETLPPTTFAAVDIDVGRARSTPFLARVERVARALGRSTGASRVESACGIDPLSRIDRVFVLATRDDEDALDAGVVLRGRFDDPALLRCFEQFTVERGGTFVEEELDGTTLYGGRGDTRLARLNAGEGAAGDRAFLSHVIRARRRGPVLAEDAPLLRALRESDGATLRAAVALDDRMRKVMAGALPGAEELSSRALAAAVSVDAGQAATTLRAALLCKDADDARAVERGGRSLIEALTAHPLVSLSPVGELLEHARVRTTGPFVATAIDLDEAMLPPLARVLMSWLATLDE